MEGDLVFSSEFTGAKVAQASACGDVAALAGDIEKEWAETRQVPITVPILKERYVRVSKVDTVRYSDECVDTVRTYLKERGLVSAVVEVPRAAEDGHVNPWVGQDRVRANLVISPEEKHLAAAARSRDYSVEQDARFTQAKLTFGVLHE